MQSERDRLKWNKVIQIWMKMAQKFARITHDA